MSERMTACRAPGVPGSAVADLGRRSHAEMVALYRRYHEQQLTEAKAALSVEDDDLIVETYLGPWAMRNRERIFPAGGDGNE